MAICLPGLLAVLLLQSCTKDTAPKNTQVKNQDFGRLTYVVQDNYTFSLFYQGLMASGYGDTLANNAGPYTIFVPNNNAMTTSRFSFQSDTTNYFLIASNPSTKEYVRYLIVPGKIVLANLPIANNQLFTTLAGTPIYISKYKNGSDTVITVNGVPVIAMDQTASNGLMNVISEVPQPQVFNSLWQQMLANSMLTWFTTAIQRAGMQTFFDTAKNITVLAPGADAFSGISYKNFPAIGTLDQLKVADTAALRKMIYCSILRGTFFTNDFDRNTTSTPYTTYNGATITYNPAGKSFSSSASSSYDGINYYPAQTSWVGGKYTFQTNHTSNLNVPSGNGIMQQKTDTNVNPARLSVLDYIAQNQSLSILYTAIQRVKLDTAMSSGGPYTFFAPDNNAFIAAGLTQDSVNKMDPQKLLLLLKYHVVLGRVSSNDLAGLIKQQFISLHPVSRPFITKNYYGIFFNGIAITNPNLEMGDGVVQVINAVSNPPVGSQLQVIEQQPDLTFFAALIHKSYTLRLLLGDPNPYSYYTGTQGYMLSVPLFGNTVLAPTDSAFKAFGYTDSFAVANDTARLINGYYDASTFVSHPGFLQAYIFTGFDFTCDFMGGYQIYYSQTSAPVKFRGFNGSMYTSVDGTSFTGKGISIGNPVKIIGPNIVATNGLIQKVNQVFVVIP
ncbi:FAS1 domain-containing protein [Russula earlei]|uniref:FAS1 domain-containing protein n=1 Tax=Russula earlei TaxID=71964 RepID=A0ACC0TXM9_9AGAM|nr:FAS1 domain-containing protein [Russula earlei]